MSRKRELTETELFDLLSWLDANAEQAAKKYETIRRGLIRIFTCRGCFEADELADETINRVAAKANSLAGSYVGEPANYFFGVAKRVYLEYQRKSPSFSPINDNSLELTAPDLPDETKFDCLEHCMQQLQPAEREIVWHYYEAGGGAARRVALAERLGLKISTLRVKVFRLVSFLETCMDECIKQRSPV